MAEVTEDVRRLEPRVTCGATPAAGAGYLHGAIEFYQTVLAVRLTLVGRVQN